MIRAAKWACQELQTTISPMLSVKGRRPQWSFIKMHSEPPNWRALPVQAETSLPSWPSTVRSF
jgi:hypothetical protein